MGLWELPSYYADIRTRRPHLRAGFAVPAVVQPTSWSAKRRWSQPLGHTTAQNSTCDDYTGHPCKGCPTDWTTGKPEQATCTDSTWPFVVDNRTVGDVDRTFPNQLSSDGTGMLGRRVAIQDEVRVPKVPAGEYVVGFRW